MERIRVMIVEDSRVVREYLEHVVGLDPRLEVAAAVGSGEEALRRVHDVSPDVISMDIRLPGLNGFETTQRIMAEKPTPIVVVSASVESEDLKISMNALRAGALAVVEKPVSTTHRDYELLASRLCTQLVLMSQVKVIRQKPAWAPRPELPKRTATEERATPNATGGATHAARAAHSRRHDGRSPRPAEPYGILGLVASTGGPNALARILGSLPGDFPAPIVIVQHITPSFQAGFVSWLNNLCPLTVVNAVEGIVPAAGAVYVAPPDRHLLALPDGLRFDDGPAVSLQRPSGTVLFQSLARGWGQRAVGTLVTGMGNDGAEGLAELRRAGGRTIVEDESTAVVFGMPGAAVRLGAADEQLPLEAVAARIRELFPTRQEVSP